MISCPTSYSCIGRDSDNRDMAESKMSYSLWWNYQEDGNRCTKRSWAAVLWYSVATEILFFGDDIAFCWMCPSQICRYLFPLPTLKQPFIPLVHELPGTTCTRSQHGWNSTGHWSGHTHWISFGQSGTAGTVRERQTGGQSEYTNKSPITTFPLTTWMCPAALLRIWDTA